MIESYIAPISKASARDVLKKLIRSDPRFQRIPTAEDAEKIADEMYKDEKWYVLPSYLLEVWIESIKEG